MLDTKQTPNIFKSNIFFSLFCCVCKSTKLNEKEIREICVEMLFSDIKQTDYILSVAFFWRRLKCALDVGHGFLTWGLRPRMGPLAEHSLAYSDGLEPGGKTKFIQFNGQTQPV